jgi:hypothetical protein
MRNYYYHGLAFFLLVASPPAVVVAQFTCTMAGSKSEDACLGISDDSNDHCVWCTIANSGFGFCVSEAQAEAMEKSLPSVQCDRYSDTDDATPNTDDDTAPETDDKVNPSTDDQVPDNYWECLLKKTPVDCEKLGCTWCDTKGGYGLCLSGPVRLYWN